MPDRFKHIIQLASESTLESGPYGSASNHYFTALYERAARLDVDIDLLLQGVGLSKSLVGKADIRVATEKLAFLQKGIWDWLNDESMGANSRPIPSGTYYMMGRLTVHESTLKKAIELGCRFYNLMFQRTMYALTIKNEQAILTVNLDSPEQDYKNLYAEICLLSWHRYMSWLIADVLPLNEAHFPYPPPVNVGEYTYLFPGVHKFESNQLSIAFPSHYLSREVKQDCSSLKVFMNRCPLELFRQYKADYSLTSEVKLLITRGLNSGDTSVDKCAEQLHMTSRTLMRKLKGEGTSFQKIKDIIRRDRAIYLLSQKGLAINEVAEQIGFSDPAVFTRAFRDWTNYTPRTFRQKIIKKLAEEKS